MLLRIHGDNIIECERALFLIASSFSAAVRWVISPPYLPRYKIERSGRVLFTVELFPGHGRWNVDIQRILQSYGAPLREAADVVVTQVSSDGQQEVIILALEFCNALPAGNNAWQRNGRALACAAAGVPYLYFAEIGGIELDVDRCAKAPRFPNPIIPFSYLTAGKLFNVVCLPVYSPSPSSSQAVRSQFAPVFGLEEGQRLVRCILENSPIDDPNKRLTQKALTITEILAAQRKSVDTLRGKQWSELLNLGTVVQKADWLAQNRMGWLRKSSKVQLTQTFPRLVELFQQNGSLSVGAKYIPLCLIPSYARANLASGLAALYSRAITSEFIEWIASPDSPLIVVWITGFKPHGEDSRPDRGLVPLARMLFGDEAHILSVVYGPARPAMWKALQESLPQLAKQNGLWEAIVNLSDAVLVDSATMTDGPYSLLLQRKPVHCQGRICFPAASVTAVFSEHDVDSTLHLLFARQESHLVFEAMCNPPGGDWSGLSILNFQTGEEYRWTSLPRVSGAEGKRPDHVIQFLLAEYLALLAIESKNKASALEHHVGTRLKTFTRRLVETPPTVSKATNAEWKLWQKDNVVASPSDFVIVSGGAFCWAGERELENALARGQLDIVFAVEFKSVKQAALLHVKANAAARFLLPKIQELAHRFDGRLEIQIH